jgi:hypothetical protein
MDLIHLLFFIIVFGLACFVTRPKLVNLSDVLHCANSEQELKVVERNSPMSAKTFDARLMVHGNKFYCYHSREEGHPNIEKIEFGIANTRSYWTAKFNNGKLIQWSGYGGRFDKKLENIPASYGGLKIHPETWQIAGIFAQFERTIRTSSKQGTPA